MTEHENMATTPSGPTKRVKISFFASAEDAAKLAALLEGGKVAELSAMGIRDVAIGEGDAAKRWTLSEQLRREAPGSSDPSLP